MGILVDFQFYMAVLGVRRGPNGLIASWRFKTPDSQPGKSNMGPVPTVVRNFGHSCQGFLARYLSCLRPGRPRF